MGISDQDIILLEGLSKQDKQTIETLYTLFFPMISQLVLNNQGDSDDVNDVFQESIIILYEKSQDPSFQLSCLLKTYFYSVARRVWLKKLNKNKRYIFQVNDNHEVVELDTMGDGFQEQQIKMDVLEQSLKKVGEPCRSLLEAYYFSKKPMQEIAEAFNYTNADNAKTQKYKCLVRLKKLFFAEYKNR